MPIIRPMIRPMIRSMITTMINPGGGGAIQRIFIDNDETAGAFYSLATPITFTDSSSASIELVTTTTSTSTFFVSGNGLAYGRVQFNGVVKFQSQIGVDIASTVTVNDGKLHDIELVFSSSGAQIFIDGVGDTSTTDDWSAFSVTSLATNNTITFNGILANPIFNNNGTITSWNLDEATANTETNNEGGNVLTYENQALDKRELFQLSGDETQWDNISPDPQELPAVIEIA